MVIVAGHWEIGYCTPIQEVNYWGLVCRDFEVSEWYMSPVSGVRNPEQRSVNLTEFANYDELLDSVPDDMTRVFLEPRTDHSNPDTTWLHDFEHPEECIYVFGSAHYNPTIKHKRDQDIIVSIKTAQDNGVLWSNQCLALVLYERMHDRMNKCQ